MNGGQANTLKKMKTKLIKLTGNHYIIVDDSEIKEGDYMWRHGEYPILVTPNFWWDFGVKYRKITHSTEPLDKDIHGFKYWTKDIIPLSLSEVEELIYGYSVEKMAEKYKQIGIDAGEPFKQSQLEKIAFIKGFNAHKELVKDKLFTVGDMDTALIKMALCAARLGEGCLNKKNEIIESLLPKTEWEVEFDEQGKLKLV